MNSFESLARVIYARKAKARPPREARSSIMIIDDNIEVIEALRQALSTNYAVVGCSSYAEAERSLSDEISVILLDIKMAPMDGFDVFDRLKQRNPGIRVIFNTAYPGDSAAVARLRNLESDGYLTKGEYSAVELEEAIARALAGAAG